MDEHPLCKITISTGSGGAVITLPPGTVIGKDGKISFPTGSGGTVTYKSGHKFDIDGNAIVVLDKDTSLGYRLDFDNLFDDAKKGDWSYDDIMFVYAHGIMRGTSTSPMQFSPDADTTQGMVVTVHHRMESEPQATRAEFAAMLHRLLEAVKQVPLIT